MSDVFPLPTWQSNANVPRSANPGGHGRLSNRNSEHFKTLWLFYVKPRNKQSRTRLSEGPKAPDLPTSSPRLSASVKNVVVNQHPSRVLCADCSATTIDRSKEQSDPFHEDEAAGPVFSNLKKEEREVLIGSLRCLRPVLHAPDITETVLENLLATYTMLVLASTPTP